MKVKELIKRLKKQDPEAEVIWQDHDQGESEFNGTVDMVIDTDNETLVERLGTDRIVALRN
jgi:hypothetical protein